MKVWGLGGSARGEEEEGGVGGGRCTPTAWGWSLDAA